MTHVSSADKIYQTARRADDHVCTLADLASLITRRHSSVEDYRARDRVVRKFAGFVVNLHDKFTRWTDDDGLWFLNDGECAAFDAIPQHPGQHGQQECSLSQ